jgi:hypothetical protein
MKDSSIQIEKYYTEAVSLFLAAKSSINEEEIEYNEAIITSYGMILGGLIMIDETRHNAGNSGIYSHIESKVLLSGKKFDPRDVRNHYRDLYVSEEIDKKEIPRFYALLNRGLVD